MTEETGSQSGHIANVGMLDLTYLKTEEEASKIKSLKNIGAVLIPEALAGALAGIDSENIGALIPVPSGDNVSIISGQTKMTGEALAAGDPETVLVIVGQVMVTTPATSVGYKALHVVGQVFAPRGSESAFASKIKRLSGQIVYIPENFRLFVGDDSASREFLEMLPAPVAFVIAGRFTFAADVDVALLRAKVPEIVLMGELVVPPHLETVAQFLAVEKYGVIRVDG